LPNIPGHHIHQHEDGGHDFSRATYSSRLLSLPTIATTSKVSCGWGKAMGNVRPARPIMPPIVHSAILCQAPRTGTALTTRSCTALLIIITTRRIRFRARRVYLIVYLHDGPILSQVRSTARPLLSYFTWVSRHDNGREVPPTPQVSSVSSMIYILCCSVQYGMSPAKEMLCICPCLLKQATSSGVLLRIPCPGGQWDIHREKLVTRLPASPLPHITTIIYEMTMAWSE
jgi:hypothetical protein